MPQFDFPYLLALSDYLSSSSQASKDASKVLRTEFKVIELSRSVTRTP